MAVQCAMLSASSLLNFIFLRLNTPNNLKIDYRKSTKEEKNNQREQEKKARCREKRTKAQENQLMLKNTCTFSSLFHRQKFRNANTTEEKQKMRHARREWGKRIAMMRWWVDYSTGWILLMLMRFIVSVLFYFSIATMNFPRLWKPVYICVTPFFCSALLCSRQMPSWTCKKKRHKRKHFLRAAVSRFDASSQSVYIALCQRRIICTIMTLCRLQFLT